MIPHCFDTSEQPAIVATKSRLGDWEGDTIMGADRKETRLTHGGGKSLFMTSSKLLRTTAQATHRVTVQWLPPLRRHVHTMTYNNGKKFARHRHTA